MKTFYSVIFRGLFNNAAIVYIQIHAEVEPLTMKSEMQSIAEVKVQCDITLCRLVQHDMYNISICSDMEESGVWYDVYETAIHPPRADQQHLALEDVDDVERLRRKIKYYFMNPCEKYHARGRKPWKLVLQIIKIAIITIQVAVSGCT